MEKVKQFFVTYKKPIIIGSLVLVAILIIKKYRNAKK